MNWPMLLAPPKIETNSGFSLLEVMIAAAITASGLAGIAAMVTASLLSSNAMAKHELAMFHAIRIAEQIHVTPALFAQASNSATSPPACETLTSCSPAQFASTIWSESQQAMQHTLPGSTATFCRDSTPDDGTTRKPSCDGTGPWVIKVLWSEERPGDSIQYRVTLPV